MEETQPIRVDTLARELGISPSALRRRLHELRVPMRRMIGAAGRPPLVVDPEVADRIRAWYARPA